MEGCLVLEFANIFGNTVLLTSQHITRSSNQVGGWSFVEVGFRAWYNIALHLFTHFLSLCWQWVPGRPSTCIMQLISASLGLRGLYPLALTPSWWGFIAWCLRHSSLEKCRLGSKHFWNHRVHIGSDPSPGPTLKSLVSYSSIWWDEQQISKKLQPSCINPHSTDLK